AVQLQIVRIPRVGLRGGCAARQKRVAARSDRGVVEAFLKRIGKVELQPIGEALRDAQLRRVINRICPGNEAAADTGTESRAVLRVGNVKLPPRNRRAG